MASNGNDNSSNPLGSLPGIRGRRGGIATRGNRLPSLRTPRDLTLGGSQKRSFVPNIPSRRDKPKVEQDEVKPSTNEKSANRDNKRGRGRNERGRGRGRGRGDLIQSHSIFEEGPSAASNTKRSVGDSYDRPTTSSGGSGGTRIIKQERKDPEEQSRILSQLMKDDFITDHSSECDPGMTPTLLPLSTRTALLKPKIKVKQDIDDEDDKKSVKSDLTPSPSPSPAPSPSVLSSADITPSTLFSKQSPASNGELILIQLPDTLPGEPVYTEEEEKEAREKSKQKGTTGEEELSQKLKKCSLGDFQEGLIGKLRVHRSGRTTLQLGSVSLDVSMGTPASFLQEVVSVYAEAEEGNMTVLGHTEHKLLCVPDFESLLDNAASVK
ncbi:hypothetical protein CAPTEDRAFT_219764 [Capitella teleta]|uniref:DNA-directed RNA polymerase III subunit RPC4 n=1 Tax=Capitella teleta TaxID=283909 RepID=R7V0H0_CAPTE|nr:hypothetical protein CAPTEDRAFT_219764 [Capitella teleta]|eukprot:ELU12039.1 hypothetical protein CAPTEDRAFT_219764 [Capitella teleta]